MNAKSFFSAKILICSSILIISACSESEKEATPLPEIVSAVHFPYVQDSSLYSFDPVSGESTKLFHSDTGLILALDTDIGTKDTIEDENGVETNITNHSATAEYVVYAQKQTLHLYDLHTQYDHTVYSFKTDPFDASLDESYICDIQKAVTLDEESRLARRVLLKDELKVYVQTSTLEDCSEPLAGFNYWQINLKESNETFTIRRKKLLEHRHSHTHFHDHDDIDYKYAPEHKHDHILEEGELDENGLPFDPNNHEHSHAHTHDFVYGFEHGHDLLTKEEVDTVHNQLSNQEIVLEEYPIFIGQKAVTDGYDPSNITKPIGSIDEALMYSGVPVIDMINRNFGYLGLNSKEHALKFYEVNLDNLTKRFLWSTTNQSLNTLENPRLSLTDFDKIIPDASRYRDQLPIKNGNLLFTSDNKLFQLELATLFDDDKEEARQLSLSKPIYTSPNTDQELWSKIVYNSQIDKLLINEEKEIWSIDFSSLTTSEPTLITRISPLDQSVHYASYILDQIVLIKKHTANNATEHAFISLSESGLEEFTIINKTPNFFNTFWYTNYFSVQQINPSTGYVNSSFYNFLLAETLALDHSFWSTQSSDYRRYTQDQNPFLLSSAAPGTTFSSIDYPELYKFDDQAADGKGESFGFIPQDVTRASKVVIFNDLFGYINIEDNGEFMTYFFSNEEKSSFNFDNEIKIMKPLIPPSE